VDGDRLADPARLTAVATLGATARSCDLNAQNSYNLSENTGHLDSELTSVSAGQHLIGGRDRV
jgi:hypothetical protein